jgi:3'-phosphoadenosine 5'-phosphosulfate sulfotransferase (PAPS reductase)/FAD synthetase
MTKTEQAKDTIMAVRKNSSDCIIMLSLGKDSLVTLDLIYPYFDRIVCLYMYFVKDLEHIRRWAEWTKKRYPKIEFHEIPHWNLSYILRGGMYCPPQPNIKLLKLADICKAARLNFGIENVFLGMKRADGLNRNVMLKGYEKKHYINKGMCYPLATWTQKDVLSYMRMHNLPEPVRYSLKASNGLGFSEDCFLWLREKFPDDLEKIYRAFPLSRRVLFEYDNK